MNLPLAPTIALVLGVLTALGIVAAPADTLEALVTDAGLPSVIAAAEPPLGATARVLLALGLGGFVGAFSWLCAFILLGSRGIVLGPGEAESADAQAVPMPVLRRADAHPDAPPRPPLLATRDLGMPFLEVRAAPAAAPSPEPESQVILPLRKPVAEATPLPISRPSEQALPADLDQPLSAYDPGAIPAQPAAPAMPVAPLRPAPRPTVFDAGERFEVFELKPPVRPKPAARRPAAAAEPIARPETEASVHALLDRLERGVGRSGFATPAPVPAKRVEQSRGLEEALATLRNLARGTAA